jgi:hypothetical protein
LEDQRNDGESNCNWRRNGPNGPTLDVYDDDNDDDDDDYWFCDFTNFNLTP